MIHWLRRRFIAGFFVAVPVVASVLALIWIFRLVDGFTAPIYARLLGRDVPGLGLITTAVAVLLVGVVATNVIGRRLLLLRLAARNRTRRTRRWVGEYIADLRPRRRGKRDHRGGQQGRKTGQGKGSQHLAASRGRIGRHLTFIRRSRGFRLTRRIRRGKGGVRSTSQSPQPME